VAASVAFALSINFLVNLYATTSKDIYEGWILTGTSALLLLLLIRKRVSTLAIGRVYTWVSLHTFLGLVVFFIFNLSHARHGMPGGSFEPSLYLGFQFTLISGAALILYNRYLPKTLSKKYGQNRAPFGALISFKNEQEREIISLGLKAPGLGLEPELISLLAESEVLITRASKTGISLFIHANKQNKHLKTLISEFNKQAICSFNDSLVGACMKVINTNLQLMDQAKQKLLLSTHILVALISCVLVLIHILTIYQFTGA